MAAFEPIRLNGGGSLLVLARLLTALELVLASARRAPDRAALLHQVRLLEQQVARLPEAAQRDSLQHRCRELLQGWQDQTGGSTASRTASGRSAAG